MILSCDACGKRYMIKDGVIKDSPKKVRCKACGNTWIEKPEVVVNDILPIQPVRQIAAVADNRLNIIAVTMAIAVICSFILLGRYQIVDYFPAAQGFYDSLNISTVAPGAGLRLVDVKATAVNENGKQTVKVTGTIVNNTKETMQIPILELNLMGKCGPEGMSDKLLGVIGMGRKTIKGSCALKTWSLSLKENKLLAGEKVNFSSKNILPEDVTSVIVRF